MKVSIKHQTRMFDIAHRIKYWSDCPNGRQHACVIARQGKYIIGTGYNGLESPCIVQNECIGYSKEIMRAYCTATHAEVNALQNTTFPEKSQILIAYVTKKPCKICMQSLKEAGIYKVYWQEWKIGYIVDHGSKIL